MAKNKTRCANTRVGAVKQRSQTKTASGNYVKRDAETGQFIDVKSGTEPFKGVRKEK